MQELSEIFGVLQFSKIRHINRSIIRDCHTMYKNIMLFDRKSGQCIAVGSLEFEA